MRAPRRFRFALTLLALVVPLARPAAQASAPERGVVIVSIDGLRPDVALRAEMPALRELMARGAFTMFCATTDVAVTLPSHTSMITGVPPDKHGVTYNGDPLPFQHGPKWPTLLAIAHDAGLSTGLAAGKSKFSVLAASADLRFVPPRGGEWSRDSIVADTVVDWIRSRAPRVLYVHLAGVDLAGHDAGWGSPEQLAAAARADQALGRIVAALREAGRLESTLILVSADHGGAGRTHGGLDARSHWIPWVAAGPGVKPGYDLTLSPSRQVRTEDTFATACDFLGLTAPKPVDGRPVREAFAADSAGHQAATH